MTTMSRDNGNLHNDQGRGAQEACGMRPRLLAASVGLGLAAAHLLATRGAQLFLIGRDAARTEAARRSVVAATPDARVQTVVADLASLDAVRSAASQVAAIVPAVDALIHNA